MASDLVMRALHYYNVGEGLTRAEIVDMARRLEALEEIRRRVADGWAPDRHVGMWCPYMVDADLDAVYEHFGPGVASVLWPSKEED